MKALVFACLLAVLASPAFAIDWSAFVATWPENPPAGPRIDIPEEANGGDMTAWRVSAFQELRSRLDGIKQSEVLSGPFMVATTPKTGYTLKQYNFGFGRGPTIESLLALPDQIDPTKPIIFAIHGHGISPWGDAPYALFDSWAGQWAEAGYVVWAPSHLWYDDLWGFIVESCINPPCDHHYIVWTKMLERIWDGAQSFLPAHTGVVLTGHSAGSMSARVLMAARPDDFIAGVFSSHFTLNYCRENCRHTIHPNMWNIEWVETYLVFDLLHTVPTQHQMGRADPYAPGNMQPQTAHNPGATHASSWATWIGQHLIRKKNTGAELHFHDGAHVYDFDAALGFVESLP